MKILDQVQEIVNKYDLKPIELPEGYKDVYNYLRDFPLESIRFKTNKEDDYLCDKYDKYIPYGWYGFSLGSPINPEWIDLIDEIVDYCISYDSDFEIHQIKLKYGGIRFYVSSIVIEDIYEVEDLIEKILFDNTLIY